MSVYLNLTLANAAMNWSCRKKYKRSSGAVITAMAAQIISAFSPGMEVWN
jgi:hypothetical protein